MLGDVSYLNWQSEGVGSSLWILLKPAGAPSGCAGDSKKTGSRWVESHDHVSCQHWARCTVVLDCLIGHLFSAATEPSMDWTEGKRNKN